MQLVMLKSDGLTDWYMIKRQVHDGRTWDEKTAYGYRNCRSDRIDKTSDVEGPREDMIDLAYAIRGRYNESSTRCAVQFQDGSCYLYSPRNSNAPFETPIPIEDADELAAQILRDLEVPNEPT